MTQNEILAIAIKALKHGGGGGTTNYNDLSNKPTLNGTTIQGNMTTTDLGVVSSDDTLTPQEMSNLLNLL